LIFVTIFFGVLVQRAICRSSFLFYLKPPFFVQHIALRIQVVFVMVHLSEVHDVITVTVLGLAAFDCNVLYLFFSSDGGSFLLCEPAGSKLCNQDGSGRGCNANGKDGHGKHLFSFLFETWDAI